MLSSTHKKTLRRLAHDLKPIVWIGDAGLSRAVLSEIESALVRHQIIKVRVRASDRDERRRFIERICAESKAELVQRVGHTATFYRRNPESASLLVE